MFLPALFFAACTAINQKDAFLDQLSAKVAAQNGPQTVFSENFESGLGQWTQLSGIWSTGTPGANGAALISPTSASASTFQLSTASNLDLRNLTNCNLQYDVRYSFSGSGSVYGQILFAGNVVGEFKNSSATSALSSAGVYVTRTVQLPSVSGKISVATGIANSTFADVRLDNIIVSCKNAGTTAYSLVLDNFESGTGNWTLNSWAPAAGAGVGGSNAIKATNVNAGTVLVATYQPNINLQSRSGCTLDYYYSQSGSTQTIHSINLYFNGQNIRKDYASVISLNVSQPLTIFEGRATNSMYLGCEQPGNNGQSAPCTIDNLILNCQQ